MAILTIADGGFWFLVAALAGSFCARIFGEVGSGLEGGGSSFLAATLVVFCVFQQNWTRRFTVGLL